MYMMEKDFAYFETLHRTLDAAGQKRFRELLIKAGSQRIGQDIGKIQVVNDSIFDEKGIGPGEFITRTMIKKAYKEAKEG